MSKSAVIGKFGEEAAALFLQKAGYEIIGRNIRCGHLEMDLICRNDKHIVFAEVKTRTVPDHAFLSGNYRPEYARFGRAASAVNPKKAENLIRGAEAYLAENPHHLLSPRIDVIEVYVSDRVGANGQAKILNINHIRNAVTK